MAEKDANGQMPQDSEDARAVREVLSGNRDAFRELVHRYADPIYSLAYRYLRNEDDAEEVVQEIFTKVYRSLESFDPSRRFFSWVYTIAMNHLHSLHRSKRRRNESQAVSLDNVVWELRASEKSSSPDREAMRKEAERVVHMAVDELREEYRNVFVLRHVQELPGQEVAEILGIPENTVKTQLRRAREQLREILTEWGWA